MNIAKKKILIFSSESDVSTDYVIDWLWYLYRIKTKRINYETFFSNNKYQFFIPFDKKQIFENVKIWVRKLKVDINLTNFQDENEIKVSLDLARDINEFLNSLEYFNTNSNVWFTKYQQNFNKIKTLLIAQEVGFNIPKTIITNKLKSIRKFKTKYKKVLSKTLSFNSFLNINSKAYLNYVELIEDTTFELLNEVDILPSLVQQYIEKAYEVRTVVIGKEIFSMALFSQNDNQTKIDFRKYNFKAPNRYIPYKLPDTVEEKILVLMDKLKLNTGSIDFIVSPEKEIFFLEVNPEGQFGFVSKNCNYALEKVFAEKIFQYE